MQVRDWFKIGAWNASLILLGVVLADVSLRWTRFDEARRPAVDDPPGYYITDTELGITLAKNAAVQPFRFRGPSPHGPF